jgi:di/tricarboxylate transporter
MNTDLLLVLGALIACVGLFIVNKPRMDVVALLVIVILPLTGIISMPEALAGFSDSNVVLIAALFVIGEGLTRTGIAYRLSDHLVRMSGTSEARLLMLLMLAVASLGSVMSSTGVVAIFVPVALNVTERLGVLPRRLMMALAYAGLISGMLTLVGTAPNMVVDGAVREHGFQGFNFFSFTPFGLAVLVIGVVYMLIARRWLGVGEVEKPPGSRRRNLLELIRDYQLSGREYRLRLRPESPLIGRTLRELQEPRDRYGATVVCIERQGRLGTELLDPTDDTELRAGDVGLIDVRLDPTIDPASAYERLGLEPLPLRGSYFTDHSRAVGMAEILLPPDSTLIGKSIAELGFRRRYGLSVIGLRRGTNPLDGSFLEEDLRAGDILLVIGSWRAIRALEAQFHDFLLLTLPAEIDQVAPAINQAPYALLSLGVMVFLMVTGIVPNVIAALIGCLMMGFFRCIDMDGAYRSISWKILLLIVGVMPFAVALERTGGVDLAVNSLLHLVGEASPHVLLASLFVLTAAIGLFISNTATAVLMAPIALSIANHLGASPYPFAMTVALASSAAFMTPISSPVNTLVLGPGQYSFGDFVKLGVPFTIMVLLVTIVMVPWLYPLR